MAKALHEILLMLHDQYQHEENWSVCGICEFVTATAIKRHGWERGQLIADLAENHMKQWPKSSGNNLYPVPSPISSEQPCDAYHATSFNSRAEIAAHMWDKETSPYAVLRWELLDFLIETTKPE